MSSAEPWCPVSEAGWGWEEWVGWVASAVMLLAPVLRLLSYISSREGRLQLVIFGEIILLSSNRTEAPDSVLNSAAVYGQPAAHFD